MHQWPQGVSDVGLGYISYNGEDQWKRPSGSWVGYYEAEKSVSTRGTQSRT